jgi:protoporphyrin/coproporphyrin ferrochelatase
MSDSYDAILIISFGGPEGMDDVMPFLQNVAGGRQIPPERLKQVACHYEVVGGVSPINKELRAMIAALKSKLREQGPQLPVYWGNRNWHPFLRDTLAEMKQNGVRKALAFVTSAYSSYSGCRQYLEDIATALSLIGEAAPQVDKIRPFYNHPLFVETNANNLQAAVSKIPLSGRDSLQVAFSAHSIPVSMAGCCRYVAQLEEICALVAAKAGINDWQLVFQSRSGPPAVAWLEPDILDHIRRLASRSVRELLIHPIGFLHDHMEVVYDLDHEAKALGREIGINMHRVATAGCADGFIEMIRQLILERVEGRTQRPFLGELGALPDNCAADCCRSGTSQPAASPPAHECRCQSGQP